MRATCARSVDQWAKSWHTCFIPGCSRSGRSVYLSAKRACPTSLPGLSRLLLQGVSELTSRAKTSTSVTLALLGMVAHRVMVLASVSVHAGEAGGGGGSAETPGGDAVPGVFTTSAGRHGPTVVITIAPSVPSLRRTPISIS